MIIDIHAHTSNNEMKGLHTKSAKISDLEKLAKAHGIVKIVLLATYFPFKGKGSGLSNHRLLERIKNNDLFMMFGSLDMMNGFRPGLDELEKLAESKKIAGIKIYPGYQKFDPARGKMFEVCHLAKRYNLPIMIHAGELHHCCPKAQRDNGDLKCGHIQCAVDRYAYLSMPEQFEIAIVNFPEVKFILSHLGNPYFEQTRELMIEFPNVYTDISGQFLSGTKEDTLEYRHELRVEILKFLATGNNMIDRIMFGTDFPIQSYEDSIALLKMLRLPHDLEQKILYQNAAEIINIGGKK